MIKCPNCGFQNDDNCTFCAICGSSVVQDDFYVHNTTSNSFSVDELNEKLITKENQKTKSFKKLDKATLAKEAAKIETTDTRKEAVKEYNAKASNSQQKKQEPAPKADTKADNKTENKADKKAESKSGNKANSKADNKTENKADTKTESKQENKADAKPEKKLENKANSKADNKTENQTDTKVDSKSENIANVKTYNKTENKNEAKAESKADKSENSKAVDDNNNATAQNSTTDSKLYVLLSKFLFDTKNTTKLFKQKDIDENCNLALISYIPFLFFVPMIIKPCSGYVRYHGIQGLTLFIVSVVLEFFDILLGVIFNCALNDMPAVILTIIFTVAINLAILLFISTGIANAVKGEARELPVIGKYKLLKQYIY